MAEEEMPVDALVVAHLDTQYGWVGFTDNDGSTISRDSVAWFKYPLQLERICRWIAKRDLYAIRFTPRSYQDRPNGWGRISLYGLTPQAGGFVEVRAVEGGPDRRNSLHRSERSQRVMPRPVQIHKLVTGEPDYPDGLMVSRMDTVPPADIRWLWSYRIPLGMATILDGDPDVGKSTLTLDLAARVTTGRPFPDTTVGFGPADVVLLSAEDDPSATIRPRLEAAGADLRRVHLLQGLRDHQGNAIPPVLPEDLDQIAQLVVDNKAALVVVDPFIAYINPDTDTYRDQQVRPAMSGFKSFAETYGTSVLLVRHLTKGSGGSKALYRGGGSIGFVAHVRAALLVADHPDEEMRAQGWRVMAQSKLNIARKAPSLSYRVSQSETNEEIGRIEWGETVEYGANELLESHTDHRREPRDAVRDDMLAMLAERGSIRAETLLDTLQSMGHSRSTINRARSELRDEGLIGKRKAEGEDPHWEWYSIEGDL